MSKIIFGQTSIQEVKLSKEDDRPIKKGRNQPKPQSASVDLENAGEFKPCSTCLKKLGPEKYIFVTVLFSIICHPCKQKFCDMANKDAVIGAIIKIER